MGHYRGKRGRQSEKGALRSLSRWASLTGSGTIHHFPELAEAKVIVYKSCGVLSCGSSTAVLQYCNLVAYILHCRIFLQSKKGALQSLSRWASLTGSGTIHHFPELAEAKVIVYKSCGVLSCGSSTAVLQYCNLVAYILHCRIFLPWYLAIVIYVMKCTFGPAQSLMIHKL